MCNFRYARVKFLANQKNETQLALPEKSSTPENDPPRKSVIEENTQSPVNPQPDSSAQITELKGKTL